MLLKSKLFLLLILFFLAFNVSACKQRIKTTADVPPVLSHSYHVSVVPFSQPLATQDLIVGQLPEKQGLIDENKLQELDKEFSLSDKEG